MLNFKSDREKELEMVIERQVKTINELRSDLRLKDSQASVEMTRALAEHAVAIASREASITKLEAAANLKAEKQENTIQAEVERRTKAFKDNFIKSNEQDLHTIRKNAKDETDAAKKRFETELESTKKSLRSEYEAKIAKLEKTNLDLATENGLYKGHNEGAKRSHDVLNTQLTAMTSMLSKLTGAIAEGLPEVSAHLTTPALPAAPAKQENKGGDQKK